MKKSMLYILALIAIPSVLLAQYNGGYGRGDFFLEINNMQLNGLSTTLYLYMGGVGRGDTVAQLNNTTLPVQLLSFASEIAGEKIKIYWQTVTAPEINNDYFTVEKSLNASTWQAIGVVDGAGNSNQTRNYLFFDTNPVKGIQYYRLRQTDFDGLFKYSAVSAINYKAASAQFADVYPNPAHTQFTVDINTNVAAKKLSIRLLNQAGQVIQEKKNLIGNKQVFDISGFANGVYFIEIGNGDNISQFKLIKE